MTDVGEARTPQEGALVLASDEVCACLDETGGRKVRLYERCERCGAFMEVDSLLARLEAAEYMAKSWPDKAIALKQRAAAAEAQVKQLEERVAIAQDRGEHWHQRARAAEAQIKQAMNAMIEHMNRYREAEAQVKQLEGEKLVIEIDLATEAEFYKARVEQLEGERDAYKQDYLARHEEWRSAEAQVKQLEGERDWGREQADFATEASTAADLAERENERLRGALWRIAECAHPDPDWHRDKARSTLVAHTEEPR